MRLIEARRFHLPRAANAVEPRRTAGLCHHYVLLRMASVTECTRPVPVTQARKVSSSHSFWSRDRSFRDLFTSLHTQQKTHNPSACTEFSRCSCRSALASRIIHNEDSHHN